MRRMGVCHLEGRLGRARFWRGVCGEREGSKCRQGLLKWSNREDGKLTIVQEVEIGLSRRGRGWSMERGKREVDNNSGSLHVIRKVKRLGGRVRERRCP